MNIYEYPQISKNLSIFIKWNKLQMNFFVANEIMNKHYFYLIQSVIIPD